MFKHHYKTTDPLCCPKRTSGDLVCYGEAVTDNILTASSIRRRLAYMVSTFPGTMWRDGGHEGRMESVRYFSGFDERFGTKLWLSPSRKERA